MAKRMGAKPIELKSSHLSLISRLAEITDLILEAARRRNCRPDLEAARNGGMQW
jgi:hypothetical protein